MNTRSDLDATRPYSAIRLSRFAFRGHRNPVHPVNPVLIFLATASLRPVYVAHPSRSILPRRSPALRDEGGSAFRFPFSTLACLLSTFPAPLVRPVFFVN